jgi:hypothetical protein
VRAPPDLRQPKAHQGQQQEENPRVEGIVDTSHPRDAAVIVTGSLAP